MTLSPSGKLTLTLLTAKLIPSLIKEASSRPTYAQLLEHPFLKNEKEKDVDMSGWVAGALEKRAQRGVIPLQTVEA